ncbi:hypothetical protein BCT16_05385 [Vibrio sp. 10N.222.54.B6]|nr:hypothetical protein BCU05_05210 [Vibrio sp. 10N.261.54.C3]PMO03699.1 hypothetical protein BCT21_06615 [Vibrio sp. 10N.222.55.F9]PMO07164.1 hypothetical protein BCT20_05895 [Vibrio sp. 10N.222.55.C12]PMO15208.1 hypothetical protein BCT17_02430 [Vibrio sp. 10N.222.54.F10]PMO23032.1 hypothetical protein BCT16_05385 [Vibrio sp. 10N.222.54.B6]
MVERRCEWGYRIQLLYFSKSRAYFAQPIFTNYSYWVDINTPDTLELCIVFVIFGIETVIQEIDE